MMGETPLGTLTEHSFTSTGKGLLILFLIGAIKIFLGINFLTSTIEIPWLPTIELSHLDRIIFVYWAFVGYAIVRYCLYNFNEFAHINSLALERQFRYGILGHFFLSRYVLNIDKKRAFRQISVKDQNFHAVQIDTRSHERSFSTITLAFDSSLTVTDVYVTVLMPENNRPKCVSNEKVSRAWGTFVDITNYDEGEPPELKFAPKQGLPTKMFIFLLLVTWYSSACYILRNPKSFDVYLPVILNIALFTYWL
ncbi:hypothetical protein RAX56_002134 [Vibrio fluvialis]|nr:hypothetical protein [Vibrio fluvialis]